MPRDRVSELREEVESLLELMSKLSDSDDRRFRFNDTTYEISEYGGINDWSSSACW